MDAIGITVDLAKYRAVVHYESCSYWRDTYHHSKLPIPPSVKWKLCSWCRPQKSDIAAIAHEITWLEKRADAMGRLVDLDVDAAQEITSRETLNGGRTLSKKKKYYD